MRYVFALLFWLLLPVAIISYLWVIVQVVWNFGKELALRVK